MGQTQEEKTAQKPRRISKGKARSFLLAALKSAGLEVKQDKYLAFKIPNGRQFVRCDSLSNDYTKTAVYAIAETGTSCFAS